MNQSFIAITWVRWLYLQVDCESLLRSDPLSAYVGSQEPVFMLMHWNDITKMQSIVIVMASTDTALSTIAPSKWTDAIDYWTMKHITTASFILDILLVLFHISIVSFIYVCCSSLTYSYSCSPLTYSIGIKKINSPSMITSFKGLERCLRISKW